MKTKIKQDFSKIQRGSIMQSYINKINVILNASVLSDNFDQVCTCLDTTIDSLLDLFED